MIRLIIGAVLAHIAYGGIEEIPLPSDIQGCFDHEYTKGKVTFFFVSVYYFKPGEFIADLSINICTLLSSRTGLFVCI